MDNNKVTYDFSEDIRCCIEVLKKGGLILYPTDTIWGIGCDATNSEAIKKIYQLKKRDASQSLISLVCDERMLNRVVKDVPAVAWDIIEYSEKPITIIYDEIHWIAPEAIAANGSAAIRMIKDEFCNKLIYKFNKPLISTSANISGEPAPSNFNDISKDIKNGVDYIVGYRQREKVKHTASSIIRLKNDGEVAVIRK
ncbi:MAG: threonylcarbamoyl-AMP synthase [Bacteroidetes bacterium]|jgi:L-threonylcarbamoyladenylate synthase|nr:threonylcarbamoyl-AMP synthase [Bacteroidota bacterium]